MKRGMKKLVTLAVSLTLALSFAVTSFAGTWIYDGPENWKWWYREDDGSYPANVWKMIDGSWYHFDANGYLDVGWTLIDDKYYYLENTSDGNVGKMRTSGTWDYGYISADGSVAAYWPDFERGYEYASDPLVLKDHTTYQTVKPVTAAWYEQIYRNIVDETFILKMDEQTKTKELNYTLPDNWREICPAPFINELVAHSVGLDDCECEDRIWYYKWKVTDNNLNVTAYYENRW